MGPLEFADFGGLFMEGDTPTGVNIPQIIAVGEQSAGKSSVLSDISGFPFPVSEHIGTHFAMELLFLRRREPHVEAVIKSKAKTPKMPPRKATSDPLKGRTFSWDILQTIVELAKTIIFHELGGEILIYEHTLRIEVAGPGVYPLKLVDLPGFFFGNGAETAMKLAEGYLMQRNSIILEIFPATSTPALRLGNWQKWPTEVRHLTIVTKLDKLPPATFAHIRDGLLDFDPRRKGGMDPETRVKAYQKFFAMNEHALPAVRNRLRQMLFEIWGQIHQEPLLST